MAAGLTLVLGGDRSGKSAFAEGLARELHQRTLYVATGTASDEDMAERIRRHQARRPAHWVTLEEPLDLAGRLGIVLAAADPPGVVVIDSLDVWVGTLLLKHEVKAPKAVTALTVLAAGRLLEVCQSSSTAFFLVSSEVGHSLVPPNPLGRHFQDLLGEVNQRVAAAASLVYMVIAGIPIEIKGIAAF